MAMSLPPPIRNALAANALCILLTNAAALADWLTDGITRAELVLAVVVYGGIAALILIRLAQRSDAARYAFLVFVALTNLNWLHGLSPFPPYLNTIFIIEIPIIALTIYWLFVAPQAADWFGSEADKEAQDATVGRSHPET